MQTIALYREGNRRKDRRKAHGLLALCVFFWVCLFAVDIPLCFYIDDATIGPITFAMSASSLLFVWAFIYVLTGFLLPLNAHRRLEELALNGSKREVLGRVRKASAIRTPSRFLPSVVVEIETDSSKRSLYFEQRLLPLPFKEGEAIRVEEVANFIVSYEVLP